MIEGAILNRELWVIGDPVSVYISLKKELSQVVELYSDKPGEGFGKKLLDKVKEGKKYIHLWSNSANESVNRFYLREWFKKTAYKEKGDDEIPEIQFEWYLKR